MIQIDGNEADLNAALTSLSSFPEKSRVKIFRPALKIISDITAARMKAAMPPSTTGKRGEGIGPAIMAIQPYRVTSRRGISRGGAGFKATRGVNSGHNFREFGSLRYKTKTGYRTHNRRKGIRKGYWKAFSASAKPSINAEAVRFIIQTSEAAMDQLV